MNKFIKYFIISLIIEVAALVGMTWYQKLFIAKKESKIEVQEPIRSVAPVAKRESERDVRMKKLEDEAKQITTRIEIPIRDAYNLTNESIPPVFKQLQGPVSQIESSLSVPAADGGLPPVSGKISYPYDGAGFDGASHPYSMAYTSDGQYPVRNSMAYTPDGQYSVRPGAMPTRSSSGKPGLSDKKHTPASVDQGFWSAAPGKNTSPKGYGFARPQEPRKLSLPATKPRSKAVPKQQQPGDQQDQGHEAQQPNIPSEPLPQPKAKILVPKDQQPAQEPEIVPKGTLPPSVLPKIAPKGTLPSPVLPKIVPKGTLPPPVLPKVVPTPPVLPNIGPIADPYPFYVPYPTSLYDKPKARAAKPTPTEPKDNASTPEEDESIKPTPTEPKDNASIPEEDESIPEEDESTLEEDESTSEGDEFIPEGDETVEYEDEQDSDDDTSLLPTVALGAAGVAGAAAAKLYQNVQAEDQERDAQAKQQEQELQRLQEEAERNQEQIDIVQQENLQRLQEIDDQRKDMEQIAKQQAQEREQAELLYQAEQELQKLQEEAERNQEQIDIVQQENLERLQEIDDQRKDMEQIAKQQAQEREQAELLYQAEQELQRLQEEAERNQEQIDIVQQENLQRLQEIDQLRHDWEVMPVPLAKTLETQLVPISAPQPKAKILQKLRDSLAQVRERIKKLKAPIEFEQSQVSTQPVTQEYEIVSLLPSSEGPKIVEQPKEELEKIGKVVTEQITTEQSPKVTAKEQSKVPSVELKPQETAVLKPSKKIDTMKKYFSSAKTQESKQSKSFAYPKFAKTTQPAPQQPIAKQSEGASRKWEKYFEKKPYAKQPKTYQYPTIAKSTQRAVVPAQQSVQPAAALPAKQRSEALQVLGFEPNTTPTGGEIARRARILARDFHPDKAVGGVQDLLNILQARDALLNELYQPREASAPLLLESGQATHAVVPVVQQKRAVTEFIAPEKSMIKINVPITSVIIPKVEAKEIQSYVQPEQEITTVTQPEEMLQVQVPTPTSLVAMPVEEEEMILFEPSTKEIIAEPVIERSLEDIKPSSRAVTQFIQPKRSIVPSSGLQKELKPFVHPKKSVAVAKKQSKGVQVYQQPKAELAILSPSNKSVEVPKQSILFESEKGIDDQAIRDQIKQAIQELAKLKEEVSEYKSSMYEKMEQARQKFRARAHGAEFVSSGAQAVPVTWKPGSVSETVQKASDFAQPTVPKVQAKIIKGSGMSSMWKKPVVPKMPTAEDVRIAKYAAQAGGMIVSPTEEQFAAERQRQLDQLLAYQELQRQQLQQAAMEQVAQEWLAQHPQALQGPEISAGLPPTMVEMITPGALAEQIRKLKIRK